MAMGAVLERFIEKSPVSVMARLAVQRAVSPEWVDSLFEEHRERQYTRELMFSSVVEMMCLVAMGLRPSLHAAAKASNLSVSTTAVYDKVNRVEGRVVRALVQQSAERLAPVVSPMQSRQASLASVIQSELRTLGQSKAALFAFGAAVVAYNVLSVLQTAVEAAHP
ncbi:hypothetical protein [Myxococcus sp. AB056]|uniref:hypothetical protein n=1 Tax=Myxococcus sp. AB056 TaxID=2562792 RepID=UPI001E421435|nr:hypothetical protein [Myxococcus sp. AB056]